MCQAKELGGMGFRDIEKFNQSLLAKQAWRIWSNPTSLVARILKHRYFARSSFMECGVGTRPSYAWRSIIHGRELLSQGLLQKIGDGTNSRLWIDNWVMDDLPRPPRYRQDGIVDLTLSVSELLDVQRGGWNSERVREIIHEEDVVRVLSTGFNFSERDGKIWGFSRNGVYNSKSGYKLAETIELQQAPASPSLSPIEKRLWQDLWKTKTIPKIRHFMWRALSGALAVKQGLRSRGIVLDTTCPRCGLHPETICHVLFHCEAAKEAWQLSKIPLPPGGFSLNSVWLNFYHLITVSKRPDANNDATLAFPWILWQLWKARNSFVFEQIQSSGFSIFSKASEEAATWLTLQLLPPDVSAIAPPSGSQAPTWKKPPTGILKCNVAGSWVDPLQSSGSAWLVRNSSGVPIAHSRRAFSPTSSAVEAELQALWWAMEALQDIHVKRVVFEVSSPELWEILFSSRTHPLLSYGISRILRAMHSFDHCQVVLCPTEANTIALQIAVSVTRDKRFQSYMATGGPSWLSLSITMEARNSRP